MIRLYNTLTRSVDDLKTSKDQTVSVYTCGPTVYLDPHIGNWRMFLMYDTLVRTLRHSGLDVNHVLNLTDVGHLVSDSDEGEDKLQKSAKAQNRTAWDVAEHYIGVFKQGLADLNITEPTHMPRATDFMDQQIDMVKTLEAKGVTYQIDDGIYFDTAKFKDYGAMARLDLAGQAAGARVEENQQKRQPQDFAVWKFSPKDEQRDMEWDSPWGVGFPGWHLECSVMAKELLGPTIDIHAGGIDHIPVHHTNEIAQSEVANDAPFSKIWLHGEFMNVDGKKMSKSLGNVYTLTDVQDKGFDPLDFRLLVLQAHYRTHQNFTWDTLAAAQNRRITLQQWADLRFQTSQATPSHDYASFTKKFIEAVSDDLNTPEALAVIAQAESQAGFQKVAEKDADDFVAFLNTVDDIFGLNFLASTDISKAQKALIAERDKAREAKDFTRSDEIRDELAKDGIELLDSSSGTVWRRL